MQPARQRLRGNVVPLVWVGLVIVQFFAAVCVANVSPALVVHGVIVLPQRGNRDACDSTDDLTRSARITVSSEQGGGEAINVVSVHTRSVHGDRGVSPDRAAAGLHRWMATPGDLPAWIQFNWDQPQPIHSVQLVFDTGMHRHLTLSHHDGYTSRMRWGEPQPETVSDAAQILIDGDWATVCEVSCNYQRLRRHRLPESACAESIRILVSRMNGIDHARIMAIRIQ